MRIPLNACCVVHNVLGTTQVRDEQITTIFHLVLQVYCSPSLKEHLHNTVMTLLACDIERKESILHAHGGGVGGGGGGGGVCVCVCVYVCVCVCVCLCVCVVLCA